MSNKPKRQRLQSLHLINVCVTVLTLIAVGVLALVLPKPTVSEVERRELAKKPEFALESWFSGEFAQQYDAYYADTFPQREELVTMASKIESMEGIRPDDVRIYQANSSPQQGTEQPAASQQPSDTQSEEVTVGESQDAQQAEQPAEEQQPTIDYDSYDDPNAPGNGLSQEGTDGEQAGNLFLYKNMGMQIFGSSESLSKRYAQVINSYAEDLDGVQVYSLIAPTSIEFYLPEGYEGIASSQRENIDYVAANLSEQVKVVDAYSEVLLGYYISDNEDYIAQYHAFRMAIQTSRHKPYEIVCDNQGGHKKNAALGLFSKISRIHRPTAPYNGESKTIENIFYRFQSQVLKKRFGFTGQNITAKRDTSRPNLEFINANIDSLPTLEELKEQYAAAREQWNSMKHPATGISRIEMYNTSVNEATDAVSVSDMVEMFWYTTEKPSLFTANGIEITVQGKKYPYEVFSAPGEPDLEWRRRNTYKKFYVQYDPYDMSSVRLLYKDKGGAMRFECVASFPLMIHRAQQEQTEAEKRFIRAQQEAVINERINRQVVAKDIEYEHGVAPEQNGLRTPDLKGLGKEAQRQIDRRTRKYSQPARPSIGRDMKVISNVTWDSFEKKEVSIRKVVGKL